MGWASYRAEYYKNGKIDRKAECDAYFLDGSNRGHYKVLKSTMKGSVYYAAIQDAVKCTGKDETGRNIYEPIEDGQVWCAVFLTSVHGAEFSYKDMDETMHPGYYDCPESILKLLSNTDNKCAIEWREKCIEIANNKTTLASLPIGTHIKWIRGDGAEVELYKHAPSYQFRRAFWVEAGQNVYVPKKYIVNWEIIKTKGDQ